MKTDTVLNLAMFAGIAVMIAWIINRGQNLLGDFLGDNPLGAVGGDDPYAEPESEEYPGWLTWMYIMGPGGGSESDVLKALWARWKAYQWEDSFEQGGVSYEDSWGSGITW